MSAFINNKNGIRIPVLAEDPDSPNDGSLWYNQTDKVFRKVSDGQISDLVGQNEKFTVVLTDNSENEFLLSWPNTFRGTVIKFTVERDGEVEFGEIIISNNNSNTSLTERRNAVNNVGVSFSCLVDDGDVVLNYSLSENGFNASFKYSIERW